MKKALIVVSLIAVAAFAFFYFGEDHQRYLEFDRQREAWHRKCDLYIGTPNNKLDAPGLACLQEFEAMNAYAKRQGWR